MPLYEYLCRECEKPCELLVRGGEAPLCPTCGSRSLTKLISAVAAHSREGTAVDQGSPEGSCGASCGCFPQFPQG